MKEERQILITGSSSGIGKEATAKYSRQGLEMLIANPCEIQKNGNELAA